MNAWSRKWMGRLTTGSALFLGACCSDSRDVCAVEEVSAPGELVRSDVAFVDKPEVTAAELSSVATGNTELGTALYRELRGQEKNFFFSPYSITQALVMTYAGARGETERQLGLGLHNSLPPERFHPAMNALNQQVNVPSRDVSMGGSSSVPTPTLNRVNAVWLQKDIPFESDYLDLLARHYNTGVRVVDFVRDAPAVREGINDWVAQQTKNRIQDLLAEGTVTSSTQMVLVNALHFLGRWDKPFAEKGTREEPFHLLDGSTQPVPMMSGGKSSSYVKGQDFEALALDYVGQEFRMVFVIPDAGQFEAVEARLSASFLDSVRGAFQFGNVNVYLPRFEMTTEANLAPMLQRLGITELFESRANLSGISRATNLHVTGVPHKAFVSVNEAGTEAAAATAVVGVGSSPDPKVVHVDRPFLFAIEHVKTRTVLFLGRYLAP